MKCARPMLRTSVQFCGVLLMGCSLDPCEVIFFIFSHWFWLAICCVRYCTTCVFPRCVCLGTAFSLFSPCGREMRGGSKWILLCDPVDQPVSLIGQLRSLIRAVIERYVFMLAIVFILQCQGWRVCDCFHLLLNCCSSMVVWSCSLMDRFGFLFFLKDPFQYLLWNWHIDYEFFSSIFIMESFHFGILISIALLGIIIWVAVFQNVKYTIPSLSDFQSLG